jgi:hypothetical protein
VTQDGARCKAAHYTVGYIYRKIYRLAVNFRYNRLQQLSVRHLVPRLSGATKRIITFVRSLRKVGLMQSMAVELSSLSDTFRPGCCMAGRAGSIRLSMTFRFGKIVCNYAHGQMARSHFPRTSHLGGVAPAVLGRGHFPRSRRKSGPPCAPSRRSASHAPSALFDFIKQDPSDRGRNVGAEL